MRRPAAQIMQPTRRAALYSMKATTCGTADVRRLRAAFDYLLQILIVYQISVPKRQDLTSRGSGNGVASRPSSTPRSSSASDRCQPSSDRVCGATESLARRKTMPPPNEGSGEPYSARMIFRSRAISLIDFACVRSPMYQGEPCSSRRQRRAGPT